VSAETPETDIATPAGVIASDAGAVPALAAGACTFTAAAVIANSTVTCAAPTLFTSGNLALNPAKSSAPDLTMAYYLPQPWGHFDIGAVLRPGLDVEDGRFVSRHFIGFGGHIGMDIKPGWFGWAKDDFTFHFIGGDALGGYLNQSGNFALATNFLAPPASATAALGIIVKPTTEWGGSVGYQHWWLDNLRSNLSFGINHHDIPSELIGAKVAGNLGFPGGQSAALNKELMTMHANVIWNPVSFVDVGVEWLWGQRQVVNNQSATMNVLISKFAFRF
jgi:hypothetical protein